MYSLSQFLILKMTVFKFMKKWKASQVLYEKNIHVYDCKWLIKNMVSHNE